MTRSFGKYPFRILHAAFFIMIGSSALLFSQTTTGGQTSRRAANSQSQEQQQAESDVPAFPSLVPNPQLALSVPDYRVTAGDIYTLSFAAGSQAVQYTIPVDTTYRIRVANLGIANASGKTFAQLKTQVEAIVTNNYPLSGVQFVLTQPAVFKVHIKGEVKNALEINAWALTRLSSLAAEDNLTQFASIRDVTIKSSGGQSRVYDLFKAVRFGDLTQDPYLRPGDEISFNRAGRSITVAGAVERPGVYQLLPGENLKELIEYYAGGFTPESDSDRIELVRLVNSDNVAGNKLSLKREDLASNFVLENYDSVTVPNISLIEPIIYAEGAVGIPFEGENLTAANRLTVRFHHGETYAALVRRNMGWFTAVSDTMKAYILRNGERIEFNLNPILYDSEYRSDFLVEANDTLVVPFRQYYVSVAGAVNQPGKYPYIPDRQWDYYIAMAGGFRADQNSRDVVDIVNISGAKLTKTDIITPETVITARANSFTYYFNHYAPVITTLLGLVSTGISIYLLTQQ